MRPSKSILDESFTYTPSTATAVDATWRRYGWKPLTEQERVNRRRTPADGTDARVVDLKVVRTA
jgi:hypothetical protein